MKTLSLWRHAKSSWADPDLDDFDRPLNARGRRDAPEMVSRLLRNVGPPDRILSSSARRTRETAAALLESCPDTPRIEYLDALYLAEATTLLDAIAGVTPDVDHLLVIGHNPGLAACATMLAPTVDQYLPTAAMVVLRHDGETFDLRDEPTVQLVVHDWPKRAI